MAAVWSVTGPLFERHIATLPAAPEVEIPSGYWKIIFIGSSPDKGEYAAFLLDQATPKSASFCDYQVTVEEIERRTHPALSFWSTCRQVSPPPEVPEGDAGKRDGVPVIRHGYPVACIIWFLFFESALRLFQQYQERHFPQALINSIMHSVNS